MDEIENNSLFDDREKRRRGVKLLEQWLKEIEDNTGHIGNKNNKDLKNLYWESLPDTLTALEISQYLQISRRRVYELFQLHVDQGGIPNFEIGASKRVVKEDFRDWIRSRKEKKS